MDKLVRDEIKTRFATVFNEVYPDYFDGVKHNSGFTVQQAAILTDDETYADGASKDGFPIQIDPEMWQKEEVSWKLVMILQEITRYTTPINSNEFLPEFSRNVKRCFASSDTIQQFFKHEIKWESVRVMSLSVANQKTQEDKVLEQIHSELSSIE